MGIPIAAAGNGVSPQQELPQDKSAARHAQLRAAEQKAAVVQHAISALPGQAGSPEHTAQIRSTAADLEQISLTLNRRLQFVVDHQSHEVIVKVIDPETDKVVKVLPPEELQRMHRQIKETIGILFDERV
ncbi:flagellin FlaG [Spirochaetia bacterium]|nr:flagellin FlaG [Spirochaetia bacterium]